MSDIAELSEVTLEGYIDGLRDAGWRGDQAALRRVFYTTLAFRYGLGPMRFLHFGLTDPAGLPMLEQLIGHPAEKIIPNSLALNTWMVRIVAEQEGRTHAFSRPAAS